MKINKIERKTFLLWTNENKLNDILYKENMDGWYCKQIIYLENSDFLVLLEKDIDDPEAYFSNMENQ